VPWATLGWNVQIGLAILVVTITDKKRKEKKKYRIIKPQIK